VEHDESKRAKITIFVVFIHTAIFILSAFFYIVNKSMEAVPKTEVLEQPQ
jgi:hypothetical protein